MHALMRKMFLLTAAAAALLLSAAPVRADPGDGARQGGRSWQNGNPPQEQPRQWRNTPPQGASQEGSRYGAQGGHAERRRPDGGQGEWRNRQGANQGQNLNQNPGQWRGRDGQAHPQWRGDDRRGQQGQWRGDDRRGAPEQWRNARPDERFRSVPAPRPAFRDDARRYDRDAWRRPSYAPSHIERRRVYAAIPYGGYFGPSYGTVFSRYYGRDYVYYGARSWPVWRKPWRVGYALPPSLYCRPLPYDLYGEVQPPPYGYEYALCGDDVLLIDANSNIVVDALVLYR